MSARLELSDISGVSEMRMNSSKKPDVTELNTVHDFGVDYDSDENVSIGGGKICVYIGESPYMLDVLGRKPFFDDENELQGMEWFVNGKPEFGVPNQNGFQENESIIRGTKDTMLYQFGATSGKEVFLLEQEEAKIIEFPSQGEISIAAGD